MGWADGRRRVRASATARSRRGGAFGGVVGSKATTNETASSDSDLRLVTRATRKFLQPRNTGDFRSQRLFSAFCPSRQHRPLGFKPRHGPGVVTRIPPSLRVILSPTDKTAISFTVYVSLSRIPRPTAREHRNYINKLLSSGPGSNRHVFYTDAWVACGV